MAYIPPHKRHFEDGKRPVPAPSSLLPRFERNLNPGSTLNSTRRKDQHASQGGKIAYAKNSISRWWEIAYAKNSISRWWAVGLTDGGHFSTSVRLEPISCEPIERRRGEKPLTLVHERPSGETSEVTESSSDRPWLSIPEKIRLDLETSFQSVMNVMESQGFEQVKPSFVARFGKLFFHNLLLELSYLPGPWHCEPEEVESVTPLRIGDQVCVKRFVAEPRYAWGGETHHSIGTITEIESDDLLIIEIPNRPIPWQADPANMEKVESFKGKVTITTKPGEKLEIPDGVVLEN